MNLLTIVSDIQITDTMEGMEVPMWGVGAKRSLNYGKTERYCVDSFNSEKYALCYFKAFSRDSKKLNKKYDSNKTELVFSLVQGPSWQSVFFELTDG